ncbi:MAG: hypothetical protein ABSB59_09395 [Streptosporangiaceae bacterium]
MAPAAQREHDEQRRDQAGDAVCTQPQTRKLLWLTGVDRRIPLAHSLDEALAAASATSGASG